MVVDDSGAVGQDGLVLLLTLGMRSKGDDVKKAAPLAKTAGSL